MINKVAGNIILAVHAGLMRLHRSKNLSIQEDIDAVNNVPPLRCQVRNIVVPCVEIEFPCQWTFSRDSCLLLLLLLLSPARLIVFSLIIITSWSPQPKKHVNHSVRCAFNLLDLFPSIIIVIVIVSLIVQMSHDQRYTNWNKKCISSRTGMVRHYDRLGTWCNSIMGSISLHLAPCTQRSSTYDVWYHNIIIIMTQDVVSVSVIGFFLSQHFFQLNCKLACGWVLLFFIFIPLPSSQFYHVFCSS